MVSCVFHLKYLSQYMVKLFVLKMSGPADFKSVPGFENWPRFVGVIEQNKISNSLCQYCTEEWTNHEINTKEQLHHLVSIVQLGEKYSLHVLSSYDIYV